MVALIWTIQQNVNWSRPVWFSYAVPTHVHFNINKEKLVPLLFFLKHICHCHPNVREIHECEKKIDNILMIAVTLMDKAFKKMFYHCMSSAVLFLIVQNLFSALCDIYCYS